MKITKSFLAVLLLIMLVLPLGSCQKVERASDPYLKELPSSVTVKVNDIYKLRVVKSVSAVYNIDGDEALGESEKRDITSDCTFVSADEGVARVSKDGVITGGRLGSTFINVRYFNHEQSVTVKVVKSEPVHIAHRGAMDAAPENSLLAFKKAAELGYKRFEFDVNIADDKNMYILHNTNLSYMCGVDLDIKKLTLQNRTQYPLKRGYDPKTMEPQYIPTVEEVLDLIAETPEFERVYLHLKTKLEDADAQRLANLIRSRGLIDRIVVVFYSGDLILNLGDDINKGIFLKSNSVEYCEKEVRWCLNHKAKTILFEYHNGGPYLVPIPEIVSKIHENGIEMVSYVVNNEEELNTTRECGQDAIFTNKCLLK
ncbi:MAG: hypothetical protein IIU14_00995 [Ruminococcus sp.]|nr:hypothetical protein [Ruminococcus sp.]